MNELIKINQLIMNDSLYNFKGYISIFKKGENKSLYLFNELNNITYQSLIDTISKEHNIKDKLDIIGYIKIYHIDIKEIDCFFNNAIQEIYSNEYYKRYIGNNKKHIECNTISNI